jgi:branched-chain amino acid transport system ATP-binding protein
MSLLLSVEHCDVRFGPVPALSEAWLRVDGGEVVGLVGPLGAGKTTLLRVVAGMIPMVRGLIWYEGENLGNASPDQRARRGIIHVPADGGFFPSLTVRENLALAQPLSAETPRMRHLTERFPVLGARLAQQAGSLSGGEQRQLAIARGVLAEPRLLLLDEPLLGLSPVTVQRVVSLFRELRDEGVAIVVVEERPTEDLETLADRLVGLRAGRVVPVAEVAQAAALVGSGDGSALDRVEVEMVGLPLSTRDRRALQTIAGVVHEPVGEFIAGLIHEHVQAHREVWS